MKLLLSILPVFWPKLPPLGVAYLQSYLTHYAIKADVLDLNNFFYNLVSQDLKKSWLISCNVFLEENIFSIIKEEKAAEFDATVKKMLEYDAIGFSCFKSNFNSTLEFIKELKSRKSCLKIILGGPEITRQYFKTKGKFNNEIIALADLIVAGEGEAALRDYILEKRGRRKIIAFLQLPDLKQMHYPKFFDTDFMVYPKSASVGLLFSRGCVRRCLFCSERLLYRGFRARKIKSVIEEINYFLLRKINYFVFFDSMLNGDLKKLELLCDAIIENFGKVNWEAQMAVHPGMSEVLFKKIKESGCYNLFIGLESGSDNTLRRMNKGFSAEEAREFFKKLNNAGLSFGISMIVGYPGETEDDFRESLDFVIKNRGLIPKIEQVNPFTYYEGADAGKEADYKLNPQSVKKMEVFIREVKKSNFKYTNAFIGNLMEKNYDYATAAGQRS